MSAPINRRKVDAALLTQGFSALMQDTRETLSRYSAEQIARSKILSKRKARLAFYEQCLRDFDVAVANNIRKAKRKTYLLGMCCTLCGCTIRVTQKWLDTGTPKCFNVECSEVGHDMVPLADTVQAEAPQELAEALEEMRTEFEQEKAHDAEIGTPLDFIRADDDTDDFLKGK